MSQPDRLRVEAADPGPVPSSNTSNSDSDEDSSRSGEAEGFDIEPQVGDGDGDGQLADLPPGAHLEAALAKLPDEVDLSGRVVLPFERGLTDPLLMARNYLGDRQAAMPDVFELERVDDVVVLRWSGPSGEQGYILVNDGVEPWDNGVIAVVADDHEIVLAEHTTTHVVSEARRGSSGLITADVLTIGGSIVEAAPDPDGLTEGERPLLGTAGASSTGEVALDIELGPTPAMISYRSVAEEPGSKYATEAITEFIITPSGFPNECGSTPPLDIDVGTFLGELTPGPASNSPNQVLDGQRVWHHPGDIASIEIRWPADPYLGAQLNRFTSTGEGADVASWDPQAIGEGGDAVVGNVVSALAPESEGPCSLFQFSLFGRPDAVDWWLNALSGQLSFGMPLTIADLDPDVGPDGGYVDDLSLVVGEPQVVEAFPQVPRQGTCDGKPDAPPNTGVGDGSLHDTAELALEAFVSQALPNGSTVPTRGYVPYRTSDDDGRIVFVLPAEHFDGPLVVVDVPRTDDGWTVATWTTSAC